MIEPLFFEVPNKQQKGQIPEPDLLFKYLLVSKGSEYMLEALNHF
jgi:hypothetical protein